MHHHLPLDGEQLIGFWPECVGRRISIDGFEAAFADDERMRIMGPRLLSSLFFADLRVRLEVGVIRADKAK